MIIDCFTFNGESDILELRLNILDDKVDQFIIVEAATSFSGIPKPLYYEQEKERFKKWHHKIKHFVIDENYSEHEILLAQHSKNTRGAKHWKREFMQKESIKKAMTHIKDDDICFIGDVDEIWSYYTGDMHKNYVRKLRLRVYTYYLNNFSSEVFYGPIVGRYEMIKDKCLNHLRTEAEREEKYSGWHFTSMAEDLHRKLVHSYTDETYATPSVLIHLDRNIKENKDFLGRNFTFHKDESHWPQYLIENKEKYIHLCR